MAGWVPVWTVRWDGTQLDPCEAQATGKNVLVRTPGKADECNCWDRAGYDARFGATEAEAIEKGLARARRDIALAEEELRLLHARVARIEALRPEAGD